MTNEARAQYWAQVLSDQASSGLTKKAFCHEHQINVATFYYWQKRLREEEDHPSLGFERLRPSTEHKLTVCLPGGEVTLRSISADTLGQVILSLSNA